MAPQSEQSAGGIATGIADKPADNPAARTSGIFTKIDSLWLWLGAGVIDFFHLLFSGLSMLSAVCGRVLDRLKMALRRGAYRLALQNDIPIDTFKDSYNNLIRGSRQAAGHSPGRLISYWGSRGARLLLRGVKTLFTNKDYFLPAAALGGFVAVIVTLTQLSFGLSLGYNGEFVGYIADESVFNRAEKQMQGRIVYEDYIPPSDHNPEYKMAIIDTADLITVNELTNRLIMASGNEITEASGLYIDNAFQGAVKDERLIAGMLDGLLDAHRTGDETETVQFVQNVEIRSGLYPTSSITGIDKIESSVTRLVQQQRIYTVQRGDAPTLIAQRNNVPYTELKKLNPTIETKLLVGQEVLLSQSVPFLGVKLIKEETYEESIPFQIQRTVDPNRAQGTVSVSQVGKTGTKEIRAKVSYVDGVEQDRVILDTRVLTEAVNEKIIVGGKVPENNVVTTTSSTSSSFLWPVAGGGRVTCGFYGYYGHTGMDIALSSGATIRASKAGVVTLVRYSGINYGNHIMIDHGGGVQTLYAHNSALYVTPGQWVEQGQAIAAMGRTGRATGVHLHFEIRMNGKYMNPASYIGTSGY